MPEGQNREQGRRVLKAKEAIQLLRAKEEERLQAPVRAKEAMNRAEVAVALTSPSDFVTLNNKRDIRGRRVRGWRMNQYSAPALPTTQDLNAWGWLKENSPNLRSIRASELMEEDKFPSDVRNFIFKFWTIINPKKDDSIYQRSYEYDYQYSDEEFKAYMWLKKEWPDMQNIDVDVIIDNIDDDLPSHVRDFILKFWTKIEKVNYTTAVFHAGPIGFGIGQDYLDNLIVKDVSAESQAALQNIKEKMRINYVNGISLMGLTPNRASELITNAKRPMTMVFSHVPAPAAVAATAADFYEGEEDIYERPYQYLDQSANDVNGYIWLKDKKPNLRSIRASELMEDDKFPSYVKNFILKFWIIIGAENDGIYERSYEY